MICSLLQAAEYLSAKLESYIMLATGAVFLGFGASSWTKDKVTKYTDYAISVGVRLLVMMLCIAVFQDLSVPFSWNYAPMFEWLAISVITCVVFLKAPAMTNSLLNGGTGMTGGALTAPIKTASSMVTSGQGIQGAVGNLKALGAAASFVGGAAGKLGGAAGGAAKTVGQKAVGGAIGGVQGLAHFGAAVAAGRDVAKQEGKAGVHAAMSGLSKATAAVGREVKGSVMNAVRNAGDSVTTAASNAVRAHPGWSALSGANQELQQQRAAGSAAGGSSSGSSSGGSSSSGGGSGGSSSGGSSSGGGGSGGGGSGGVAPLGEDQPTPSPNSSSPVGLGGNTPQGQSSRDGTPSPGPGGALSDPVERA
jgi:type IV secretory pathway TrbL component